MNSRNWYTDHATGPRQMDPMLAEPFSVVVIGEAATSSGGVDMHEVLI